MQLCINSNGNCFEGDRVWFSQRNFAKKTSSQNEIRVQSPFFFFSSFLVSNLLDSISEIQSYLVRSIVILLNINRVDRNATLYGLIDHNTSLNGLIDLNVSSYRLAGHNTHLHSVLYFLFFVTTDIVLWNSFYFCLFVCYSFHSWVHKFCCTCLYFCPSLFVAPGSKCS